MARPEGSIPVLATDANYPAGTDPWSGQPTKVNPGSAVIAAGVTPDARLPARHHNYVMNGLGVFLADYLDQIDVQNWSERRQSVTGFGFTAAREKPVIYDESRSCFWAAGNATGAGKLYQSFNGIDWTDQTPSGGGIVVAVEALGAVAVNQSTGILWTTWASTGIGTMHVYRLAAGVWTDNLLSANSCQGIYWTGSEFAIFGGTEIFNRPAVWSLGDTWGSLVSQTLPNTAGFDNCPVLYSAQCTGQRIVALVNQGANTFQWDAPSLASNNWTNRGNLGLASKAVQITCTDPTPGFVIACEGGHVYSSTNGLSWNLRGNAGLTLTAGALAIHGSVWTVQGTSSGTKFLAYSVDEGGTWNRIPWPFVQGESFAFLGKLDRRLIVGSTSGLISYSLRTR